MPPEILDNVAWLRGQTPLPICIGFGISRPEHVRMLAPVADGLIVGSAIVRRVAEASTRPREAVLQEIGDYVGRVARRAGVAGAGLTASWTTSPPARVDRAWNMVRSMS